MTVGELQRQVGESLRRWRTERGLTQENFAELLMIHRTYMGALERGERNLSLQTVETIAQQIGVDPRQLIVPSDYK